MSALIPRQSADRCRALLRQAARPDLARRVFSKPARFGQNLRRSADSWRSLRGLAWRAIPDRGLSRGLCACAGPGGPIDGTPKSATTHTQIKLANQSGCMRAIGLPNHRKRAGRQGISQHRKVHQINERRWVFRLIALTVHLLGIHLVSTECPLRIARFVYLSMSTSDLLGDSSTTACLQPDAISLSRVVVRKAVT